MSRTPTISALATSPKVYSLDDSTSSDCGSLLCTPRTSRRGANTRSGTDKSATKVFVRVRPFNIRELYGDDFDPATSPQSIEALKKKRKLPMCIVNVDETRPTLITTLNPAKNFEPKDTFVFERCFNSTVANGSTLEEANQSALTATELELSANDQGMVYTYVGQPVLHNALDGYNGCIFAYGQTGSGKTFTMMGPPTYFGPANLEYDDSKYEAMTPRRRATGTSLKGGSTTPTNSNSNSSKFQRQNTRNNSISAVSSGTPRALGKPPMTPATSPSATSLSPSWLKDDSSVQGITPRLAKELYLELHRKREKDSAHSFRVEVEYYEIYNEKVMDLLNATTHNAELRVRNSAQGPYVEGLTRKHAIDADAVFKLLLHGNAERHTAATRMNERSSRSHAILALHITQMRIADNDAGSRMVSKLHLVDLAGSERTGASGVVGKHFQEATRINLSLTTLGRVIDALADISQGKQGIFCPYRDSNLTWLLRDSLGGNSKTTMVATISPHVSNFDEACQTLRYASRAKQIVTKAIVNEDPQQRQIKQLTAEVERLQRLLNGEENSDDYMDEMRERILTLETELESKQVELGNAESELITLRTALAAAASRQQQLSLKKSNGASSPRESNGKDVNGKLRAEIQRLEAENLHLITLEGDVRAAKSKAAQSELRLSAALSHAELEKKSLQQTIRRLEKEAKELDAEKEKRKKLSLELKAAEERENELVSQMQTKLSRKESKAATDAPPAFHLSEADASKLKKMSLMPKTSKGKGKNADHTPTDVGALVESLIAHAWQLHNEPTAVPSPTADRQQSQERLRRAESALEKSLNHSECDTAESSPKKQHSNERQLAKQLKQAQAQWESERSALNQQITDKTDAYRRGQMELKCIKEELKNEKDQQAENERRLVNKHHDAMRRLEESIRGQKHILNETKREKKEVAATLAAHHESDYAALLREYDEICTSRDTVVAALRQLQQQHGIATEVEDDLVRHHHARGASGSNNILVKNIHIREKVARNSIVDEEQRSIENIFAQARAHAVILEESRVELDAAVELVKTESRQECLSLQKQLEESNKVVADRLRECDATFAKHTEQSNDLMCIVNNALDTTFELVQALESSKNELFAEAVQNFQKHATATLNEELRKAQIAKSLEAAQHAEEIETQRTQHTEAVAELTKRLEKQRAEAVQQAAGELTRINEALAETSQQKETLAAEAESTKKLLHAAQEQIASLEADIIAAEERHATHASSSETAHQSELSGLSEKLAKAQAQRQSAVEEVEALKAKIQEHETTLDDTKEALQTAEAQLTAAQSQSSDVQRNHQRSLLDAVILEESAARVVLGQKEMHAYHVLLGVANGVAQQATTGTLEAQVDALRVERDAARAELANALSEHEKSLGRETERAAALESQTAALQQEKQALEQSKLEHAKTVEVDMAALTDEIKEIREANDTLRSTLEEKTTELQSLTTELAQTREEQTASRNEADERRTELEAKIAEFQEQIATSDEARRRQVAASIQATLENEALVESVRSELLASQREAATAQSSLDEALSELNDQRTAVQDMKRAQEEELQQLSEETEQLRSQCADASTRAEKLESQLEEKSSELAQATTMVEEMKNATEQLELRLDEYACREAAITAVLDAQSAKMTAFMSDTQERVEASMLAHSQKVQAAEEQVAELKKKMALDRSAAQSLEEQCAVYQEEIRAQTESHEHMTAELQKEISTLQQSLTTEAEARKREQNLHETEAAQSAAALEKLATDASTRESEMQSRIDDLTESCEKQSAAAATQAEEFASREADLLKEVSAMQVHLEEVREELSVSNSVSSALKEKVASQKQELNDALSERDAERAEHTAAQEQNALEREALIQQSEAKLSSATAELEEVRGKKAELEKKIDELSLVSSELCSTRATLAETEASLTATQNRVVALEKECTDKQATVDTLTATLESARMEGVLQTKQHDERVLDKENTIVALKGHIATLQENLELGKKALHTSTDEKTSLSEQLAETQHNLSDVTASLDAANKKVAALHERVESLSQTAAERLETTRRLDDEIKQQHAAMSTLQAQVDNSSKALKAAELARAEEHALMCERLKVSSAAFNNALRLFSGAEAAVHSKASVIAESLLQQLTQQRAALGVAHQDLTDTKSQLDHVSKQLSEKESELADSVQESASLEDNLSAMRSTCDAQQAEIAELKQAMEALQLETRAKSITFTATTEELKAQQQVMRDAHEAKCKELTAQVSALEGEIQVLRNDMAAKDEDIKQLKENIEFCGNLDMFEETSNAGSLNGSFAMSCSDTLTTKAKKRNFFASFLRRGSNIAAAAGMLPTSVVAAVKAADMAGNDKDAPPPLGFASLSNNASFADALTASEANTVMSIHDLLSKTSKTSATSPLFRQDAA